MDDNDDSRKISSLLMYEKYNVYLLGIWMDFLENLTLTEKLEINRMRFNYGTQQYREILQLSDGLDEKKTYFCAIMT